MSTFRTGTVPATEYRVERKSSAEAVGEPGPVVWELQEVTLDEHGDVVDVDEVSVHPTRNKAIQAMKLRQAAKEVVWKR